MPHLLKLQIITPKKKVFEEEVSSVTAPSVAGEITILYNHIPLFSQLKEGIVKVKKNREEYFFSIGGGYLETTGKTVNLLVSQAYHQDEIDEEAVKKAQEEAKRLILESKTKAERHEAAALLRRSLIDLKLVKKRRRSKYV